MIVGGKVRSTREVAQPTTPLARARYDFDALDFTLPVALAAREPPEARGLRRDEVRLLVSHLGEGGRVEHARFDALPGFLRPGDLLVVNRSATIEASLPALRADGEPARLHLSTRRGPGRWVVELRRLEPEVAARVNAGERLDGPHGPLLDAAPGERLALPAGVSLTLRAPLEGQRAGRVRLWHAELSPELDGDALLSYVGRHGTPIRYSYVRQSWPLTYYQTMFSAVPGSAEMPSASRPFSASVLDALQRRGVEIAHVLLHTGVSSAEQGEPPQPEHFEVDAGTVARVARARAAGRRVIAVGTTATRAIESAVNPATGELHPASGMTRRVITPEHGLRVVDGLITGLHEPRASHLALLEAVAGRPALSRAYAAAVAERYLWHEFGDTHLLLP